MRQPRIAQCGFVFLADAAARACDQRRRHAALRSRQHGVDPLCHPCAQIFNALSHPLQQTGRPRRHDHARPAIDKPRRTDGLEVQAAPDIGGARRHRRGRRIQPGRQADPITGPQCSAHAQRHPHPARRLARGKGTGTHIFQNQPHAPGARFHRHHPRRQMRDDRMIQHWRRHRFRARPGQREPQQQRRCQRQRHAGQAETRRHGRDQAQPRRRPAPRHRRFKDKRKIQSRARAQAHRQPQRPASLFPTPKR